MSPRRVREPGVFTALQLSGHAIAVAWVVDLEAKQGCEGCWHWSAMRIDLDASLTRTQAQEVLIHECAHAVSDIHGLKLSEKKVHALALGLHQMLAPYLKVIR